MELGARCLKWINTTAQRPTDYSAEAVVRKVRPSGEIKWKGRYVFASEALAGEPIGLTEIGDNVWLVKSGPIVLGTI